MAKMDGPTPEATAFQHPSQSREQTWPQDLLLRKNGFQIAARLNNSEACWCGLDGQMWTQSAALAWIAERAEAK